MKGNNRGSSSIEKLIKSIDIFGEKIDINFQNQQLYKTVFGGTITLLIGILFLCGCWFFGSELVYKQNPAVISSQRSVAQAKRIDIQNNKLIAMIGVSDGASQIWTDPTIFSVRLVQEILKVSNDTQTGKTIRKLERTNKQVKICDKSDVGIPTLESYYGKLDLTTLYCFKGGQDLYMEGDFDADKFAQVFFYIDKCVNSTSTVICKPPEVIQEKLRLTKIQIFMSDTIIDPLNFHQPFSEKGINLYSSTSSSFPKELQIFFTNQYIQDDVGFIFQDIKESQGFVFTDMKETTFFSDSNVLARVLFRIQKQKENLMQRRYQKFADIVAQIGGLLKILTTVGTILSYPISRLYLYKAVGDELFNFTYSNSDKQNDCQQQIISNSRKNKNKQINTQVQLNKLNPEQNFQSGHFATCHQKLKEVQSENQQELNTIQSKEDFRNDIKIMHTLNKKKSRLLSLFEKSQQYFKIVSNPIQYNFSNFFKQAFFFFFVRNNEKTQLVNQGIKNIEQHLDVLFIIKKFHEIDKLKSVLLNEDQQRLFDFIPKPIISSQQTKPQSQSDTLTIIQQNNNFNQDNNTINEIKSIENTNIKDIQQLKQNVDSIYSVSSIQKTDEEKAKEAYKGLQNLFKKDSCSKIDLKLIELIEPLIMYKFNQLNGQSNQNRDSFIQIQPSFNSDQQKHQLNNIKYNKQLNQKEQSIQFPVVQIKETHTNEFTKGNNEEETDKNQEQSQENQDIVQQNDELIQQNEQVISPNSERNALYPKKSTFFFLPKLSESEIITNELNSSQKINYDDDIIQYNPALFLSIQNLTEQQNKKTVSKTQNQ